MTGSIVVLGATGYAGGLAVEALVRRGARPTLVGTRADALKQLAARHGGLEWRTADANDLSALRSLVDAGDVLVTTVGPFNRLGRVVARAAAAQGAHYVDSTGEVGFVRHLVETLDAPARTKGSTMLPAFGYDYVPGLLAGGLALDQAPHASGVDIGYVVRGSMERGKGLSQGTRRTMTEEIGGATLVRSGGGLAQRRMASQVESFPVDGHDRPAVLAGGTEVLFLPRHWPDLADVRVFNGWFPEAARATQVLSAVGSVLTRLPFAERVLAAGSKRLVGPAGGPDAATRARSQGGAVAIARDEDGRELARVELMGPNSYDITAELMAWAAEELAQGHGQATGVVDGISAFGLTGLRDAAATLGLVQH